MTITYWSEPIGIAHACVVFLFSHDYLHLVRRKKKLVAGTLRVVDSHVDEFSHG